MSNSKLKKLTPVQQEYQKLAAKREPKRPLIRNIIIAFVVGGLICTLGQVIQQMFVKWAGMGQREAANPTVAILVLISVVLTSFGVYDKIAQHAGAGTAVPVTGFANAMASPAIEHRSEGLVLGTASNMFKLAGPVIVFGTVAAFLIALLRLLIKGG